MSSLAVCSRHTVASFLALSLCAIPSQASGQASRQASRQASDKTSEVQDSGLNDQARSAAALLAERCASCHGPGSENRKAIRGWADARDLASTVADAELIVPGAPGDSYLYLVIEDGDMPPQDSDVPQLDSDERAIITGWIRAGAVLPGPEPEPEPEIAPDKESPTLEAPPAATATAESPPHWMKQPWPKWLGRFHPTVVHFPVALLTAAFIAEVLAKLFKRSQLHHAATFSYTLGALSTVPSAAFGWLLAESTMHRGDELFDHRWMGVTVAVVSILGMSVFYRRPGVRLPLLALLAVLVGITGHLGGSLSYGSDWLSPPF